MHQLHGFDKSLIKLINKIGHKRRNLMLVITTAGSGPIVGLIIVASTLLLHSSGGRFYHAALLVTVCTPLVLVFKLLARRVRRDTIYVRNMIYQSYSFPSGHAYGSMLVYGFLAYLSAIWLIYVVFGILILLIGSSRVYLGAHYPSDVIGGWLLALITLSVILNYTL